MSFAPTRRSMVAGTAQTNKNVPSDLCPKKVRLVLLLWLPAYPLFSGCRLLERERKTLGFSALFIVITGRCPLNLYVYSATVQVTPTDVWQATPTTGPQAVHKGLVQSHPVSDGGQEQRILAHSLQPTLITGQASIQITAPPANGVIVPS